MSLLSQMGLVKPAGTPGLESEFKGSDLVAVTLAGLSAGEEINESIAELNEIQIETSLLGNLMSVEKRIEGIVSSIANISVDGMTQREAMFVNNSVQEINEELGADLVAMPAVESFGDRISARNFTEVSLESIKDSAKEVWKFIIATIKKIKDMFATWWDKFFGSVERLKKYAEKVKAKADSYKDDKDNKKITVKGKTLYVGATAPDAGKIVSGAKDLAESVANYSVKQSQAAGQIADLIVTAMEKAPGEKDADVVGAAAKWVEGKVVIDTVPDTGIVFGDDIMGGKAVYFTNSASTKVDEQQQQQQVAPENTVGGESENTPNLNIGAYKSISGAKFSVSAVDKSKSSKDVTKDIDRLSKSEVETAAGHIVDMCEAILDQRKSRQDARKYADDITKASDNCRKKAESDEHKEAKSYLQAQAKAATEVLKEVAGGSVAQWTAHIVAVGQAVCKVAEQSI